MKIFKIHIVTGIIAILMVSKAYSQQDNTLFFMNKLPQSNLVNPGLGCDCKLNIWGLLIPAFGQLPPPVSFNLGNTGFSLKKLFKQGEYRVWDETIIDTRDSLIPDFDYLLKAMRRVNYITSDLQIHLLGVGYKYEDWYFNIGITEKANFSFGYPKDFVGLLVKGNGAYIDKPADLRGLGLNFTHYREYMAGATRKINDKLSLGGHLKMLFGKTNINTRKSDIKLYTDPTTFYLQFQSNMQLNLSLPDSVSFKYDENDSVKFRTTTGTVSMKKYLFKRKNIGMGLDFGAVYKINDKIQLSASIIDLGFIRWRSNTSTLKQKGEFTFQGINFVPYLNTKLKTDSVSQAFKDSLFKDFMITSSNNKYTTSLTTKMYIGGAYELNEFVNFGLVTRTELYQRSLHLSFSLSANTNFYKWLSASLTYSMINRYYMNIGIGVSAKASFMQFYFITDNFFGIRPEKSTGMFMPYRSRDMNFRFGCNMVFGCQNLKQKGNSML